MLNLESSTVNSYSSLNIPKRRRLNQSRIRYILRDVRKQNRERKRVIAEAYTESYREEGGGGGGGGEGKE